MEREYWLSRKRASLAMARKSPGAVARLIHLDLAGRYSVKAANCRGDAATRRPTQDHPASAGPNTSAAGERPSLRIHI